MGSARALLSVLVLSIGCGMATPSPVAIEAAPTATPESRHGVQGLLDDLIDAGIDAEVTHAVSGDPLTQQQTVICANGQSVRVFVYGTPDESVAAARRIDPDDPTNVGTAIVEWDGWPRFWQRDRIIVLYLGRDEPTIAMLTELLGAPFAVGFNQRQRRPDVC